MKFQSVTSPVPTKTARCFAQPKPSIYSVRMTIGTDFQNEMLAIGLRACAPLYWHRADEPWPRLVTGATCFFVTFDGESPIAVTAAHVVRQLLGERAGDPKVIAQIGTCAFDPEASLIAIDDTLDLATFRIAPAIMLALKKVPVSCYRANWPPPDLQQNRGLILVGFPENRRIVHADGSAIFEAFGALPTVEDYDDRSILITYDPSRDLPIGSSPLPELHANMSGCSGGLVLMVGEHAGITRWHPAGVVIAGPHDAATGLLGDIDLYRARRVHFIRPDGSISTEPIERDQKR